MRAGSVLAGVEIPVVHLTLHTPAVYLRKQFVIVLFTDRAADDFADAREEYIGSLHGLSVGVLLHVERLDFARVVGHDDRTPEVLLDKIAFVLAAEVHAPSGNRELELHAVGDSLPENFDALCIGKADEVFLQYTFQACDELLVDHLVQELKVVLAVVQCPPDTVLDEIFLQVHQFVLVDEGDLRLDHPELCQVAGRVGVFGTERRPECVDGTE